MENLHKVMYIQLRLIKPKSVIRPNLTLSFVYRFFYAMTASLFAPCSPSTLAVVHYAFERNGKQCTKNICRLDINPNDRFGLKTKNISDKPQKKVK